MILFLDKFSSNVNSGLLIVYGLIVFVIGLIATVLIIDKIKHRKKDALFHSKHLKKRLKEIQVEEQLIKEEKNNSPKEIVEETENTLRYQESVKEEIIEQPNLKTEDAVEILESHELVKKSNGTVSTNQLLEKASEEEVEKEPDLEKTQAQIEVEEITKALERAVEEEKELNKYAKYEEEQELNAIISYDELKEKFDELYDSNEKIQYASDDTLPINLKELYDTKELVELQKKEERVEEPSMNREEEKKIKSEELYQGQKTTEFKKSPIISPVYGIQKEEFHNKREIDERVREEELQKTADFLNTLKELQRNLD